MLSIYLTPMQMILRSWFTFSLDCLFSGSDTSPLFSLSCTYFRFFLSFNSHPFSFFSYSHSFPPPLLLNIPISTTDLECELSFQTIDDEALLPSAYFTFKSWNPLLPLTPWPWTCVWCARWLDKIVSSWLLWNEAFITINYFISPPSSYVPSILQWLKIIYCHK